MAEAKITPERISAVISDATSMVDLLRRLEASTTSLNYRRLEKVAGAAGITLPEKQKRAKVGMRPNNSKLGLWDEERLKAAVQDSTSMGQVLKAFGGKSRDFKYLKLAAEEFGIELPHGTKSAKSRQARLEKLAEKYLVKKETGRRLNGQTLRRLVVGLGLLEDACSECKTGPEWLGKRLVLQVDHKNGDGNDNRIENLQILCPNCHSQTDTYCGRNKGNSTVTRHGRPDPLGIKKK